jgi:hemerythrin-like domain-containing protein
MPKAVFNEKVDVVETIRRPDIIENEDAAELIVQDHRKVDGMIKQLRASPDRKLLEELAQDFLAHSEAEEEEVYRDLRQFMEKEGLFDDSFKEHEAAELALADLLDSKDLDKSIFIHRLDHFATLIQAHVAKEEEFLVKYLRDNCSKDHRIALGSAFKAAKDKHKAGGASGKFIRDIVSKKPKVE